MEKLTIVRPDDFHIHLRDGDVLAQTVTDVARRFKRAIVMPNLKPPVITVDDAANYRNRILNVIPKQTSFEPLMTLYLTNTTTPEEIKKAKASSFVYACKLYPQGATTHSDFGVQQLSTLDSVFAEMEQQQLPLLVHAEVVDSNIDVFDREKVFLERELQFIIKKFPRLRIVVEHITTKDAVQFVMAQAENVAATITVHHLLLNRNDLLAGGIRPHHYCLPVLKRQEHQEALLQAAISGNKKFFLGTDSAPHARKTKETTCGCAGIYTANAAIELYAQIFDDMHALDKLENFASRYGADFYRLPHNEEKITLIKKEQTIPEVLPFGDDVIVPLFAGKKINWSLQDE